MERRSLKLPITLGVILIILTVLLTVGWVLLSIFTAIQDPSPGLHWALLAIGVICFLIVLIGIITYLVLSIRVINSTRRQANFIDAVTHELKTPIASLKLSLQTLNTHALNEHERADFYRLMLADAQRLDMMISQVLAAARLDHPTDQQNIVEMQLDRLIQSIVTDLETSYPTAKIQVDCQPLTLKASESEMRILISNLLSNALKYGGDPPEVTITGQWLPARQQAQVLVQDNGHGIPLRERNRIFRRFVRLENELERRQKGTGLGLYLVKTITDRLRGSVRVLRSDARHGTIFELCLPARLLVSPPPSLDGAKAPETG